MRFLFFAAALAFSSTATAQTTTKEAKPSPWAAVATSIAEGDWDYLSESDSVLVTSKSPRGSAKRLWVRYDWLEPQPLNGRTYLVQIRLTEADCEGVKSRGLSSTTYATRSMSEALSVGGETSWSYPVPNSFGEAAFNRICGLEEPNQK